MLRSHRTAFGAVLGLGWACACTPGAGTAPEPARAASAAPTTAPAHLPYETLDQVRFRLLEEQDTDCDQKITIRDRGSRRFQFRLQGQAHDYRGTYALATLLDELSLAGPSGAPPRLDRVGEDPVARVSRRIRQEHWPALVRRLDEQGLPALLDDPTLPRSTRRLLYVPGDDERAYDYFRRVARRYDAAHAELARATAGLGGVGLSPAELGTMLRTAGGRETLADLSRRLGSAARALAYPGLVQHLTRAQARLAGLLEQASRSCVNTHSGRLRRVAERARDELAKFRRKTLGVEKLPERREWPEWSAALGSRHGPLSLALEEKNGSLVGVPFVVPSRRESGMYGWGSHFIVLGLIADERLDLARGLLDNIIYEIEHYGATLATNRSHSLTRAQPPFFASSLRALWEALPPTERDRRWLSRALGAAIREYHEVWSQAPRRSSLCRGEGEAQACLDRYAGAGQGQPPEVEPGHFDWLWRDLGRSLEQSYRAGELRSRDLVAELDRAFEHDRCMRESGHDTTYRWFWHAAGRSRPENRCADMLTVDLNSLLYRYEVDVASLLAQLEAPGARGVKRPLGPELGPAPRVWCARAKHRFELMKAHLWSARDGLFYDALLEPTGPVQTGYVSATTLYPLWATADACVDASAPPAFSRAEKSLLVTNALARLEAAGGLLASARASRERFSREPDRQWDYPHGWAPHQMLAWQGLDAHGFREDADRLTSAWLFMQVSNAVDHDGAIAETYDVVARTVARAHPIASQRANVGPDVDPASGGFGWMNASFEVGLSRLSADERRRLNQSLGAR